jgi:hypothetical protein
VERGLSRRGAESGQSAATFVKSATRTPGGRTLLLNLSPLPYLLGRTSGKPDVNAQNVVQFMSESGVVPRAHVETAGWFNKVLRWRKSDQEILCVVKNCGDWSKVDFLGTVTEGKPPAKAALAGKSAALQVILRGPAPEGPVTNVRTGRPVEVAREVPDATRFADTWTPCEAALYTWKATP